MGFLRTVAAVLFLVLSVGAKEETLLLREEIPEVATKTPTLTVMEPCRLTLPLPTGYTLGSGGCNTTVVPLPATKCSVQCQTPQYIGTAVLTCAASNATFGISGCTAAPVCAASGYIGQSNCTSTQLIKTNLSYAYCASATCQGSDCCLDLPKCSTVTCGTSQTNRGDSKVCAAMTCAASDYCCLNQCKTYTCPFGMKIPAEKLTFSCGSASDGTCSTDQCCVAIDCPAAGVYLDYVQVDFFSDVACSTKTSTELLAVSLGSNNCFCNPPTSWTASTNYKCDKTAGTVTYAEYQNSYICDNRLSTKGAITVSKNSCTQLTSTRFAKVTNFTGCSNWSSPAALAQQVAYADFPTQILSTLGISYIANPALATAAQRKTMVDNIILTGSQVFFTDVRFQQHVDTTAPPMLADGTPLPMKRQMGFRSSRIWSYGSPDLVRAAVVSIVDPTKSVEQLNISLPDPPLVGTSAGQWMSDLLVFTRFDPNGNVITAITPVKFDVSCSNVKYLGVCRFEYKYNPTCEQVTTIVQNGADWCTVTAAGSTNGAVFIAYQATTVIPKNAARLAGPSWSLLLIATLMVAMVPSVASWF